jgi:hypothetical protein
MPENTVKVCRPSKWGNPFHVADVLDHYDGDKIAAQADCVRSFHRWIDDGVIHFCDDRPPCISEIRRELAGKNLACWCKNGTPCHADVLLDLANVKEHATPLAGAGVETGVEVHVTGDSADKAASWGCVSRLVVPSSFCSGAGGVSLASDSSIGHPAPHQSDPACGMDIQDENTGDQGHTSDPRIQGIEDHRSKENEAKEVPNEWHPWKSREEMRSFEDAQKVVRLHKEDALRDVSTHCEAPSISPLLPIPEYSIPVERSRHDAGSCPSHCRDTDPAGKNTSSRMKPSAVMNEGSTADTPPGLPDGMARSLAETDSSSSNFLHNV